MDSKEHNSGAMKVNIHHLYYVLLIAVLIIGKYSVNAVLCA